MEYKEFAQRRVKNLMESLDAHLGEEARAELMEACGRACARAGPARVARDCQGNLDQWLDVLARWHGGVDVTLVESVKRGSQRCRLEIQLGEVYARADCQSRQRTRGRMDETTCVYRR